MRIWRLDVARGSPRRLRLQWLGSERTRTLLLWVIVRDRSNL